MWSARRLDTSWILRFLFPPLLAESDEDAAIGTSGAGVRLPVVGAGSVLVLSDLTEDAELGETTSSSLGFLEALSGVSERDEPGLERGERLRVEAFIR